MLKGLTLLSLCGIKLCVSDELTDKLICTRGLTDRAIGYGPIGWGFESLRARHLREQVFLFSFFVRFLGVDSNGFEVRVRFAPALPLIAAFYDAIMRKEKFIVKS